MVHPSSAPWALPVVVLWAVSPFLAYETGLPRKERLGALEPQERRRVPQDSAADVAVFRGDAQSGRQLARSRQFPGEQAGSDRASHLANQCRTADDGGGVGMGSRLYLDDRVPDAARSHCSTTLQKLPRYRGHLFNWYDTQSLVPLAPLYVSTVDSGNLLGYLITVGAALPRIVESDLTDDRKFRDGLADTLDLFERDAMPLFASIGRDSRQGLPRRPAASSPGARAGIGRSSCVSRVGSS